jgi:ElaB/YqjD/DUF883 family membrane-anchored ribosome-binding protein
MGERDDARRSIEDARERMSAIAEELARRASPGFVKDRAREVAVRKTTEYRDRAVSSPGTWSLLGGILGATTGAAVAKRVRQRREISAAGGRFEPAVKTYEYGYSSPSGYNPETSPYGAAPVSGVAEYGVGVESGGWSEGGSWQERGGEPSRGEGLRHRAGEARERARDKAGELSSRVSEKAGEFRERASSKSEELKERASSKSEELRERASSKAEELKERASSKAEELKARTREARERMPEMRGRAVGAYRRQVNERPLGLAFAAIGLGFVAALLLPVTQRERQLAGPAKGKVRRRIESMEEQLESRIGGDSGNRPAGGYDASSRAGGRSTSPSPTSAPYYGEDVGVVEDTSSEGGSRYFESSSNEPGGRTIH